jgi:hypothetical protein
MPFPFGQKTNGVRISCVLSVTFCPASDDPNHLSIVQINEIVRGLVFCYLIICCLETFTHRSSAETSGWVQTYLRRY